MAAAACKLPLLASPSSLPQTPSSSSHRGLRRQELVGLRRGGRCPSRGGVPSVRAAFLPPEAAAYAAVASPPAPLEGGSVGYSLASYYTSLGLFVISVPGLWSLIKRSVKSKVVQKTFELGGEKRGAAPNQVAGEILSLFTRNNFAVSRRGDTITFEGMMVPSRGQAALLTFCTCISLASVGLVLSIAIPEGGNNWFWLTLLSPLAGAYYWKRASRKEEIEVKMTVANDGSLSEIIVRGDDQQVEQMRKELQLSEKGMVYVKGIFER
uniref:Vacuolar protein sorting-associated protein 16 n=1 Tax=Anthurium amnicola TaxID=1678845 RepID=A0A1D1ZAV2_9ARAE